MAAQKIAVKALDFSSKHKKKDLHPKKIEKKVTRAKIKKSAPGKVNLFSLDMVTTQTRSKVMCDELEEDFNSSKSQSKVSAKSMQVKKEESNNEELKQSPKKRQAVESSNKTSIEATTKDKKVTAGKSFCSQKSSAKSRKVRGGRRLTKSPTDVYKSRHNIGKRAASGRVFSYKETEISLVFPDNYWSSSSCKVDLALPRSSSSRSSSSSKSSDTPSEDSDFNDHEIQFNFEAHKRRSSVKEGKDTKRTEKGNKKSEQGSVGKTSSIQTKKTRAKSYKSPSRNAKSCDSDSSTEEEDDEDEPVKKAKKARISTKHKKPNKRKSKPPKLQPRSPRIQRTACLNANAINSLMYDYSAAPKKPKALQSAECSQEEDSSSEEVDESEEGSSTEEQSQSEDEKRPSPRKDSSSKYKNKKTPEKKSAKSKKKPKVPDKKKIPKKRRKRDIFDDVIISVPAKRMASLNAQAIMAACKDLEEAKPLKIPKESPLPKEVKEKQEKLEKPAACDEVEKSEIKSQTIGEQKEQTSPLKRKKSPLRGMKLLQKQVLATKNKVEQNDTVNAKLNNQQGNQQQVKSSGKDPYEFIDVVDVDDQKSPVASGQQAVSSTGLRTGQQVSSPEIQVVDPPGTNVQQNMVPGMQQGHFQSPAMRPVVPTAKPVPHYPPLNMAYRMNDPQMPRHPQAHFTHAAGGAFRHSYPHSNNSNSNKVNMPPQQTSLPQGVVPNPVSQQSSQASPFQRPPSHHYGQSTQQQQQQQTFHSQGQAMYNRGVHPPPVQQTVPPYPPTTYPNQPQAKQRYEVPTSHMGSVGNLGVSPPPLQQQQQQPATGSQMMIQGDSSPSSDRSSTSTDKSSTGGGATGHIQVHKTTQMGNTATYPYPHGGNAGQNVSSQYMQGGGQIEGFGPGYHHHQMVGNARHYGTAHAAFGPTGAYQPVVAQQHQRQDNSGNTTQQQQQATAQPPHNFYMRYGYFQPAGPLIHPAGTAFHLMQQQPHLKNFMPPAIVHSQPFRPHTTTEAKAKNMVVNKMVAESKSPSKSTKSSQDKSKANTKALDLSIESKSSSSGGPAVTVTTTVQTSKQPPLIQPSPMKPTKDILDLDSKKVRVHKGAVGETDRGSPLKTTKASSAKKQKLDGSGFPVQTYKFEPKQHQMGHLRPNVAFVQGCRGSVETTNTSVVQQPTAAETKTVASNITIPFYSMPLSGHVPRMPNNPNLQVGYSLQKLDKSPKKGTQVKGSGSKGKSVEAVGVNMDRSASTRPAVHMQLPQMMKPVMSVIPIPSVPPAQQEIYSQTGARPAGKGTDSKPPSVISTSTNANAVNKGGAKGGVTSGGSESVSSVEHSTGKKVFTTTSDEKKSTKKDHKKADNSKSPKRDSIKSKEAKISKSEPVTPGKSGVPSSPKIKPDSPRQKPKPDLTKMTFENQKVKHVSPKAGHDGSGKVKSEKCKQTLQFTEASGMKDDPRVKHEFLKRKLEMKQKGDMAKNKSDSMKGIKPKPESPRSKLESQKLGKVDSPKGKLDSPKQRSDSSKIKLESPKGKQDKSENQKQRPDSLKIKPDSPRQQKSEQKAKVETPKSKGEAIPKQKKEDTSASKNGSSKKERRRSAEEKKLSPGNGGRRRIQSAPPVIHCAWRWEGLPELKPVSFQGESPVLRKCYPAVRHADGDIVRVRDCVLVKSGPRKRDIPFVAKIAALWEHQYGELMMSVLWYYRPEQTEMERLPRRERCEIFASRHRDVVPVACIDDKAYVLTFNEFCRYKSEQKRIAEDGSAPSVIIPQLPEGSLPLPPMEAAAETVFLCRRVYDVKLKRILKNPQASYIQQSPNSSKPHTPNSSSKSSSPHSESPIDTHFQQSAKVDLMQQFMNQLAHMRYQPDTSDLEMTSQTASMTSANNSSSTSTIVKSEIGIGLNTLSNFAVFPSPRASLAGGYSGMMSKSPPSQGLSQVVKTDLASGEEEQKPAIPKSDPSIVSTEQSAKQPANVSSSLCDKRSRKTSSSRQFGMYFGRSREQQAPRDIDSSESMRITEQDKCEVVVKMEDMDTMSVSSTETETYKKPEVTGAQTSTDVTPVRPSECSSTNVTTVQPSECSNTNMTSVQPSECSSSTGTGQQLQTTATSSLFDSDTAEEKNALILPSKSADDLKNMSDSHGSTVLQSDHIQEAKISSQNLNCSDIAGDTKGIDEGRNNESRSEGSSIEETGPNEPETKPVIGCSEAESTQDTDGNEKVVDKLSVSRENSDSEIVTKSIEKPGKCEGEEEVSDSLVDRCDSPDPERLVIDTSDNTEQQNTDIITAVGNQINEGKSDSSEIPSNSIKEEATVKDMESDVAGASDHVILDGPGANNEDVSNDDRNVKVLESSQADKAGSCSSNIETEKMTQEGREEQKTESLEITEAESTSGLKNITSTNDQGAETKSQLSSNCAESSLAISCEASLNTNDNDNMENPEKSAETMAPSDMNEPLDKNTVENSDKSEAAVSSQPLSICTEDLKVKSADLDEKKSDQEKMTSSDNTLDSQSVVSSIMSEQITIAVHQADSSSGKGDQGTEEQSPKQQQSSGLMSPAGLKSPSGLSRIEQIVSQIKMAGGAAGGGKCTEGGGGSGATTTTDMTETVSAESKQEDK